MKNIKSFEQSHYDDAETDLFAIVKFVGNPTEILNAEFLEEFETLWSPEQINDIPTWKVFVFDTEGYEQLVEFLNREIGAKNFSIKIA